MQVFKTPYKPEEIQKILRKHIHKSRFYHHNEDAYVGSVHGNDFRYCYMKANVKNSFPRDLVGRVSTHADETYIRIKYVSGLLNSKLIICAHLFLSLVMTLCYLTEGVTHTFTGVMFRFIFGGFLFSAIPVLMGYISTSTPPCKKTQRRLIELLEDTLFIEEVHCETGQIVNEG